MLKARKANRVIRIPDEKKDAYAALGYKITDMNDKVVAEPHNAEKAGYRPGNKAERGYCKDKGN